MSRVARSSLVRIVGSTLLGTSALTAASAAPPVTVLSPAGTATVTNNDAIVSTAPGVAGITATGATGAIVDGTGSVTTSGTGGIGIDASANGDVSVAQTSVATSGNVAFGVRAISAAGNSSVALTDAITTGNDSTAINVRGNTASVSVSGTVSTTGTGTGISATNGISINATAGIATVTNTGSVSVAGANTTGIALIGTQGVVLRGGGSVTNSGAGSAAVSATVTNGAADITTGTITTSGDQSIGIIAEVTTGTANITTGAITTNGFFDNGVQVTVSNGTANVTTGTVTTIGDRASGIIANGTTGSAVNTANISTNGTNAYGAYAFTSGGVASVDAGDVVVAGPTSIAIYAASTGGSTNVTADSVTASGAGSRGIIAQGLGVTSVTVGNVSATGGTAVEALGGAGSSLTLNGAARAASGPAVQIGSLATATLTIGQAGSITAAGGAAELYTPTSAIVNNAGTIAGSGAAPILTVGAPAALGFPGTTAGALLFNNAGRFTGTIGFTAADDRVNNSGTYTALYSQDFGAGADTFNNSGTLAVLPGTATAGTVTFTALENFANAGRLELRNGHAGDTLALSGIYSGAGAATLGVDVNFSAGVADRLVVAGAISGSTSVEVTPVGGSAVLNRGVTFATGGAGSSPTGFTVSDAAANGGLYRYGVAYSAATASYALVATPGDSVFRALKINEGANELWHKSADSWSAHMSNLRDARMLGTEGSGRIWGSFTGSEVLRKESTAYTSFGQTRSVPLSYRQDAFGGQVGADLGATGGDGAVSFGVTGGYLSSHLTFRSGGDHVTFDAANVGVYAGFVSGPLFANLLAKYDRYWARSDSPSAGYVDRFHGEGYGVQGEVGARIGSEGGYVEPVVRLAYVRTNLNDLRPLGTTIDFEAFDGLRGKAGARAGAVLGSVNTMRVLVYGEGNYVHEFKGTNGIAFTSGGQTLGYRNTRIGDFGEARIGFSASSGGVTGFIEGFGQASRNDKGGGGRAGLRIAL